LTDQNQLLCSCWLDEAQWFLLSWLPGPCVWIFWPGCWCSVASCNIQVYVVFHYGRMSQRWNLLTVIRDELRLRVFS
jgi:hypothetical protein